MTASRRPIGPAIGAVVSAAAGASVWAAGAGTLRLPGGWSGRAWLGWWDAVGPLVAVFSLGRVVLVGVAALLFVVFAVVAVAVSGAGAAAWAGHLRAAGRLPGLGPMVRLALTLSASGAAAAACGATVNASSPVAPPAAPVLTNIGPPGSAPAVRSGPEPPSVSAASARSGPPRGLGPDRVAATAASVPPAAPSGQAEPGAAGPGTVAPPPGPSAPATGSPDGSRPQPGATWNVRPGESLWSIAEATAGVAEDQVAGYWAELIALNRPTLPVPDNPSLLFPGDVVRLPAH